MPTNFPGGLDDFTNPTPADDLNTPTVLHTDQHSNLNDAVEALEAKVGADGSAVTTTLDYQMSHHAHTGADGSVQVDYNDLLNLPVIPPGVTPSATVEDETTYGQTPDAGVSTDFSRGDHTHGTPDHDSYNNLTDVPSSFPPSAHATSHEDSGTDEIDVTGLSGLLADAQTPLAHNLLSTIHGDTLPAAVVFGDILVGNSTPAWARLPIGTTDKFLRSNGTFPSWQTIAAGDIGSGAALTKTDDTNVTLTLGGSPTTALLAATSLTLGWTGTLAAGRLNSNVVQAITNDTNIQGSIAAQNLTLAWAGTLAAARLNANVVQSVVDDTNVTGSISAQALTLGWTGTLAVSRGGTGASALSDVLGTTNQVNVSGGTARVIGGDVTLSLPQNIHTGATPTFAGITLTESANMSSTTINSGYNTTYTGASSAGGGPQNSFTANDGSALDNNHRLGALLFNGFDGGNVRLGAAMIVQANETWSAGAAYGTRISFFVVTTGTTTLATPFVIGGNFLTLADGVNVNLGTTNGTKFGTTTSQKIGFFNATPVVQPGATTDLGVVLSDLGLRASGTAYPISTSGIVTLGTPAVTSHPLNIQTGSFDGIALSYTGASGASASPRVGFYVNDGAAMASGDRLGSISFGGRDNAAVADGAFIQANASQNWTTTTRGTEIRFFVTVNGASLTTRALTIENDLSLTLAGNLTMADATNIVLNTTTGTKIGTATAQKLGFYNATPIIQPAAAAQAAAPAGGVGATAGAWSSAANRDAAIATINAMRTALINLGLIKGSA